MEKFKLSNIPRSDNQKLYPVEIMSPHEDGYIRGTIYVPLWVFIKYKLLTLITQRIPRLSQS